MGSTLGDERFRHHVVRSAHNSAMTLQATVALCATAQPPCRFVGAGMSVICCHKPTPHELKRTDTPRHIGVGARQRNNLIRASCTTCAHGRLARKRACSKDFSSISGLAEGLRHRTTRPRPETQDNSRISPPAFANRLQRNANGPNRNYARAWRRGETTPTHTHMPSHLYTVVGRPRARTKA